MRTSLRIVGASVAVAAAVATIPLLSSTQAQAAGFTGGDLVVYRVGSGAALTNAAAPVFLDEFGPTGTKLQSIALPTAAANGNNPLTATGQSRSEGLISRSADGKYLAVTGYAAAPGTTGPGGISLTGSDPASVKRVVGVVDAHGGVDTSTVLDGASAPQIIRSAVTTNGDDLFAAGGDGGVLTTSLGSSTTSVLTGDATTNLSALTVQSGALFTSGILADRLSLVTSGPSGGTLTDVPGLPDNLLTYGYAVLDLRSGGWNGTTADTIYLANASERGGTVDKYSYDGTTWALAGSVDVAGVTGLVADDESGVVSLAVTTPTTLLNLTDTNGASSSFAPAAATTLATAPAGTEFRGVALAPTATPGPSAFLRTPTKGATASISAATIPVTAYVTSPAAISSVKVTIGSQSATASKGAGDLWTANVPTSGLVAGAGTVSLAATDASGTTTVTRAITLEGTSAPVIPPGALTAGKHAPSESKVKRTGTWTSYATAASPTKKGLASSKKGNALTASVYGKKLVLTFGTGPKLGKVTVTVDGKATTVDLYAKTAKTLSKTYSFPGALKAHPVKLAVAGSKNPKSKGTAVDVAALTVS